jgi:hypothetical protein
MGSVREWLDRRRERRRNRRELRKERAARRRLSGGDATEVGFMRAPGQRDNQSEGPGPEVHGGG